MKFVCLGFMDESKWENLSAEEGQIMMQECLDYDDELRRGGHFLGGEALSSSKYAVTLRFKNGQVGVSDGPFAETKEVLGGILLLEARDLNHAISLISRHPNARVGPWEIRAADEQVNALIAEREADFAASRTGVREPKTHSATTLRAALKFSYEWIKPLADDVADAPLTSPTPGLGNHPLWIMGHLVFSSSGLLSMISGETNPYERWKSLFEGGTQPVANTAHYPAYSEVLNAYDATHQSAIELLARLTDSKLEERPPAVWEALRDDPDFQTIGKIFLFIAMHEMLHRGQLADARRALGRKPIA
jgi:hypothetical protein